MQQPSSQISPSEFFEVWECACAARKTVLLNKWFQASYFTAEVFNGENDLVSELAAKLNLEVFTGYYSIDAIFFKPSDRVHCSPPGQTWVQNIRIAFEHENFFGSGLFAETSHLLITRADLRVLVTYPGNDEELFLELNNLARIISESDLAATNPAFLFIAGKLINGKTDIEWQGFTFDNNQFQLLN